MTDLSRRRFVSWTAAGAALGIVRGMARQPVPAPTAHRLIERVKADIGVAWRDDTGDALLSGDTTRRVTGVATTVLPTLEVLRQVVAAGANVVFTSGPLFYTRGGEPASDPPDPVVDAKRAFIAKHGLVIFRLGHHWHLRSPDPRARGLASVMEWTPHAAGGGQAVYETPVTSLESLARTLVTRLGMRGGLRAIGDRALPVRRIGVLPGVSRIASAISLLPHVDAIVAGEVWEWETSAYVQDVVHAGIPRGFISIGRVMSEAPGMQTCARWLRTLAPEVAVRYVPAGDPYWRPH